MFRRSKRNWKRVHIVFEYDTYAYGNLVTLESEMVMNIKEGDFLEYLVERELEQVGFEFEIDSIEIIAFSYMN